MGDSQRREKGFYYVIDFGSDLPQPLQRLRTRRVLEESLCASTTELFVGGWRISRDLAAGESGVKKASTRKALVGEISFLEPKLCPRARIMCVSPKAQKRRKKKKRKPSGQKNKVFMPSFKMNFWDRSQPNL